QDFVAVEEQGVLLPKGWSGNPDLDFVRQHGEGGRRHHGVLGKLLGAVLRDEPADDQPPAPQREAKVKYPPAAQPTEDDFREPGDPPGRRGIRVLFERRSAHGDPPPLSLGPRRRSTRRLIPRRAFSQQLLGRVVPNYPKPAGQRLGGTTGGARNEAI